MFKSRITLKQSLIVVLTGLISACASTPDVVPMKPEPAPQQILAPVTQAPTYLPPVQEAMPMAEVQDYTNAPVPGSLEDFIYSSGEDRVYFGYDRFDLNETARNVLRGQAEWLQLYPNVSAVIAGHADERGTRNYNLALGARRADSVKDYLISLGVNPRRLTSVSFGKERPVDARSNDEGWARNRNVHTNLTSGLNASSVF